MVFCRAHARAWRGSRLARLAAGAVTLGVAAAVAGCVDLPKGPFPEPSMAVASPLAAELKKQDLAHAGYPAFFNIPGRPTDVRPASAWTRNIYNTLRLRRQNLALEALYPQTIYGALAFAQVGRTQVIPPAAAAEAATQADRTAAFAKEGRQRATPPSPVQ